MSVSILSETTVETPDSDKPAKARPWSLLLRVGFSAAILTWLATRVDWDHVADAFRSLRWEFWLGAVGLYIVCQLLCSLRWQWLSRPLGFNQSLARFTSLYYVGMFFNLFLPTSVGGDAVRAVYLANGTGRRLGAFLSVLLDRISGLLVLLAVACVTDLVSPVPIPWHLRAMIWGAAATAGFGLAILPVSTKYLARLDVAGTGLMHRVIDKISQLAESLQQALKVYRRTPRLLAATIGLSLLVQLLNVILVWWVGLAVRLDVPLAYYGIAYPMVTLLTLVPVSLNGMGIREGGMVLFLGAAGVSPAHAVSLAFLWFCAQTAASLIGAFVYLFGRFPRLAERCDDAVGRDSGQGRARQLRPAA